MENRTEKKPDLKENTYKSLELDYLTGKCSDLERFKSVKKDIKNVEYK